MSDGYKLCAVAYLDILGWKSAIYEAEGSPDLQRQLREYIDLIFRPAAEYEPSLTESHFSDCILITLDLQWFYQTHDEYPVECFWLSVWRVCHMLLLRGFLVRGGIVQGAMYHKDNVAFGPALIEAWKLEQIVGHPAVMVSENCGFANILDSAPKILRKIDGRYFFDFLKFNHRDPLGLYEARDEHTQEILQANELRRPTIVAGLTKFGPSSENRDPKIYAKYRWFAEYFNSVGSELGLSPIDLAV